MNSEESIYHKCGEIFLDHAKTYTFLCYYCNELFYEFEEFKNHSLLHLNGLDSENIDVTNLDPIDEKLDETCEVINDNISSQNQEDDCDMIELKDMDSDNKSTQNFKELETIDSTENTYENIDKNDTQNKLNDEICPYCKIEFKHGFHDYKKCSKIQEVIYKYDGDFIKLLREGILCCCYCKGYFKDYKKLYEHHIEMNHCSSNDQCKTCKFYRFMNLKINSSKQNSKILIKSKTRQTNDEKNDVDAFDSKINQDYFSCRFCNEIFKEKFELEDHYSSHENSELPFKCNLCERVFKRKSQMQIHMRIHNNERPYKCDICSSAFTVAANLRNHIIYKHTEDRPYVCDYEGCDATFKLFDSKKQHEKRHLPANFQCEMCGNDYKTKFSLLKHQQSRHVDAKNWPHQCEICNKRFALPEYLADHKRIHSGEKPFGCDICSKFFRKRNALREHKKLHSEERKYICRFCGKGFKQVAGYWGHMKRHPIMS